MKWKKLRKLLFKKKTKKKLIVENRLLTGIVWFYIVLCVLFAGTIHHLQSLDEYPSVSLYRGDLGTKGDHTVIGRYRQGENHILVSLNSSDNDRIAGTLYHEYGHFIYSRIMNDDELKKWEGICKMDSIFLEDYKNETKCEEEFAFTFSGFIVDKTETSGYLMFYDNPEGVEFVGEMYEKYINEKP